MPPRLSAAALLLALAAPAAAQPAREPDSPLCREEAPPPVDVTRLDEAGLRALIADIWVPEVRTAAIAELRRRFPSPAARAFAANAEALEADVASQPQRAYDLYTRVRAEYAGNPDPAVELEVARAIVGQIQALGLAEAIADREPLRPLGPGDIDPDSPSNRLRRELIAEYGDRRDPAMRAMVGWQRYNLLVEGAIAAGQLTDPLLYLALVEEYRALAGHPAVAELVARILFDLAFVEPDDARQIAYYDGILRLFSGATPSQRLRGIVSDSYSNKAFALEQLGRGAEAARVQEEQLAWMDRTAPPEPDAACVH